MADVEEGYQIHNGKEYTNRGFGIYGRFIDEYKQNIRVQESSVYGSMWIFCDGGPLKNPTPNLTPLQARKLASILISAADEMFCDGVIGSGKWLRIFLPFIIGNMCGRCGKKLVYEHHPCPYDEEINDIHEPKSCNCCEDCEGECLDDI
jgi:hypothetical protein